MNKRRFIITPEDVEEEALARGLSKPDLKLPSTVIFTFSQSVISELKDLCGMEEWEWKGGQYSAFYNLGKGWRCKDTCAFMPPMGASPMAALCEDFIRHGARMIFLLCGSWGLGKRFLDCGQIHLPTFACGMDGTTCHYGNKAFNVKAEKKALGALSNALDDSGADWKKGGVGCCEAFYRITRQMMNDFRKRGCLSMENGEVAALYTIARIHKIPTGVLLQPYIDLEQGWKISYMGEKYRETCRMQARVALEVAKELL